MKHILFAALFLGASLAAGAYTTDSISVSGPGLDHPMKALVITPDAAAANPDAKFNTVYLLHGYSGDEKSWTQIRPNLGELADQYGTVLVMPDAGNTWYFDSPLIPGQQVETFITTTLVPYVDAHYPTIADRKHRAVSGLSMGGHGAFWLASRHPDLFGAVGATSGGVDIRPFTERWKIAEAIGTPEPNPEAWSQWTAAGTIPTIKDAGLAIIFDCGSSDFFHQVNEQFHRDLLEAGVPHDYISRPGTHNWDYWRNSVLYHMLFFNEFFNKAE